MLTLPSAIKVKPPKFKVVAFESVRFATALFASITGRLPVFTFSITLSDTVGTPAGVQLLATDQVVEVLPFQV